MPLVGEIACVFIDNVSLGVMMRSDSHALFYDSASVT